MGLFLKISIMDGIRFQIRKTIGEFLPGFLIVVCFGLIALVLMWISEVSGNKENKENE